jgi:hypothetical protein
MGRNQMYHQESELDNSIRFFSRAFDSVVLLCVLIPYYSFRLTKCAAVIVRHSLHRYYQGRVLRRNGRHAKIRLSRGRRRRLLEEAAQPQPGVLVRIGS